MSRYINPGDIALSPGYSITPFAEGLTSPICIIFDDKGNMLAADAGVTDGNGKVLRRNTDGSFRVIADGFNVPLTGITFYRGNIYVAHRGSITIITPQGNKQNIIEGLPSWGDHHNNQVVFGADGKMYFGQGTATNSGVVGEDNAEWVEKYPFFHDYPGSTITLKGFNFTTPNILTMATGDTAVTGAYAPFGVPSFPGEQVKGITAASGSILRANPDGSGLEQVAWGLRNPFRLKFDRNGRLFAANHGADVRGSRPINNSPDEFQLIKPGTWYGWPDFTGGYPVTLPVFKAEGRPQPQFLLAQHPMLPPKPIANFMPHSAIMGFDINYNIGFGPMGDVYIAEFGAEAPETTGGKPLPGVGHRVSRIDMNTGKIYNFAINKSGYAASYTGGGGLEQPIDVLLDGNGTMYVADFGVNKPGEVDEWLPATGVIWKITRQ